MTPISPITGVSTQGIECLGQTPMPSPPDSLNFHLPSHLPWKHHAHSNKTRHLLCCCQHRGNSHIHAPPFLEHKYDHKSLCITLPQISTHVLIPGHHPIKTTPICESALLEQHTNTTFQTLMGIEYHCHMEHQGQGLPQCSQQILAKRTCQRNPWGKVGN